MREKIIQEFLLEIRENILRQHRLYDDKEAPCESHIVFCVGCGYPIWSSTCKSDDDKDHVIVNTPDYYNEAMCFCEVCREVKFRNPEIFEWMMRSRFWHAHAHEISRRYEDKPIGEGNGNDNS
jgi:hypothetical protein